MKSTKEEIFLEDLTEKTYERAEILQACIEYFNGDVNAADVWINKYALKDSEGKIFEKNS